jgi:hypothetical protein
MIRTAKRIASLLIFIFTISFVSAQEYMYEIGPTYGASFYSGDANNFALFTQPEQVTGFSVRRNYDLRTALKIDLLQAAVSSNSQNFSNKLPLGPAQFKTTFYDINAHLEYSFFSYSDSFKYKETRRFSPYIFAGLGATLVVAPSTMARINIPFGVGVKYKLFHRINIGTELSMNMLLSDRLERLTKFDSPYSIPSSSNFKNNDWFSYLKFYITFDIIKPDCKCNNIK